MAAPQPKKRFQEDRRGTEGIYIENEMTGITGALVINLNTVVCTVIMKFSGTKHPIKLTITRSS